MPIVASRGDEIRRLLAELSQIGRHEAAILRLRALGSRIVPHVGELIKELDGSARRALIQALDDVDTDDARALRKRLARIQAGLSTPANKDGASTTAKDDGVEAMALQKLRALPTPRADEPASMSRDRGEAHLTLARSGSRLARKALLQSLAIHRGARARLYCEAAGLIGDVEFLAPLAALGASQTEATKAMASIATREGITARSKVMRSLDAPVRLAVAKALAGS